MKKRLFAAALCLLLAFGLALFASACDDTGNAGPAGGGSTVNTGGAGEDEKETFKLIYGAGEGGFLSASADGEKFPYILHESVEKGENMPPVYALASDGYTFVKWSDGVTDNPRTDTNVQGDIDVEAVFERITYTLTYTAGAGGTLSSGDLSAQNKIELNVAYSDAGGLVTAVPDAGYTFVKWSDGKTQNPRFEPGVFEDMAVQAVFGRITYPYTYTAGAGGHLEVNGQPQQSPYAVQLPEGESVTVTAVPETGYTFVKWSDDVETATRTDSQNGGVTVTAEFERITYTLAYSAEAGGAVFGQASQTVGYGESGTRVTAVPAAGYTFVKWDDGVKTADRTDSGVQEDIEVTAEFTPVTYTLTYSAEAGGTLSSGDLSAQNEIELNVAYSDAGGLVTAEPADGYVFAGWSDGVKTAVRTDTAWADFSVSARFEPDETSAVTVTYEAQTDENGVALGTVAGARVQRLAPGQKGAPVTALPAAGYAFAGWSDGETGATRSDSAEESVTFTALFEPEAETDLFAGGTGTAEDPFLIADLRQLRNIQVQETRGSYEDSKKHYKLTCDIVLDGGAPNFVPLDMTGQYETQNNSHFRGHLDGGGHSIKNLCIVAPGGTAALFVGIAEGSVKNLNIVNAYIAGTEKVAGIAGTVYNGQVVGCRVQGTLEYLPGHGDADASYIGGVAGAFTVTSVSGGGLPFDGCSADVTICARDVAGTAYVGGAVGSVDITGKNAGPMSLSAEAAIHVSARGEVYAGGLAGYARNALSLQNSTFAGTIEAACRAESANTNGAVAFVGGLVGNGVLSSSLTLQNCTAEGTFTVYGDGAALGGLVGAAAGLTAADSGFDGALRVFCGQVAGAVDAGGIAATVNGDCTVERCSAAGTIALAAGEEDNGSAVRAGGLLGRVTNGDLIVGDSYACTTISLGVEYAFAGGLLGQASAGGSNAACLEFCYAAGGIVDLPASGYSSLGACVGIGDGMDVMNVHWLQGRGASAAINGSGIGQDGFVGHAAEGEITAELLNDGRVEGDAPWQEGADGLPVLAWENEAAQACA